LLYEEQEKFNWRASLDTFSASRLLKIDAFNSISVKLLKTFAHLSSRKAAGVLGNGPCMRLTAWYNDIT
jgi:hypothetical protein